MQNIFVLHHPKKFATCTVTTRSTPGFAAFETENKKLRNRASRRKSAEAR